MALRRRTLLTLLAAGTLASIAAVAASSHTPQATSVSVGAGAPSLSTSSSTAPVAGSAPLVTPVSSAATLPRAAHSATPMLAQQAMAATWFRPLPPDGTPKGLEPAYWSSLIPADNGILPARISLGKKLYFDTRLSKDGTVACATCHDTGRAFGDRRATSEGIGDTVGQRNAPTTMNAMFYQTQFWDGRAKTLEDQAKLPIVNPIEMGQPNGDAVMAALKDDADYASMFTAAYGRAPNFDDLARAIATFERTLVFIDAPFDRLAAGDNSAVSEEAQAGWVLYNGRGRCQTCHPISSDSPLGIDHKFHNIGTSARHRDFDALAKKGLAALNKDGSKEALDRLALQTDTSELGRFMVTRERTDIGAFKSSQIRNVGVTAPYMHDGSMATLWDVVDHYNKAEANPYLDRAIEPLGLNDREVDQLVAFLFTLTDHRLAADNQAEFERQKQIAASSRPFRDLKMANRPIVPIVVPIPGAKAPRSKK